MKYNAIKKFLTWFHQFDEEPSMDVFSNEMEKEDIRKAIWHHVQLHISNQNSHQKRKIRFLTPFLKVAASVILLSSIIFLVYRTQVNQKPSITQIVQEESIQKYETPKGKPQKLQLQDGTEIWINGGSKLRIPKWTAYSREVFLDQGEAFFHVHSDSLRPFFVHTQNLKTKVLGTSFNIKYQPIQKEIWVSLKSGKVLLLDNKKKDSIPLLPADQVAYSVDKGNFEKSKVDPEDINAWISHRLIYKETLLSEILNDLSNLYGMEFALTDKEILQSKYNIRFEGLTSNQILRKLELIGQLKIETKGNINHIKKEENQEK